MQAKSKDVGSSPTRGKTFAFWSLKSLQPIRKSPTFIAAYPRDKNYYDLFDHPSVSIVPTYNSQQLELPFNVSNVIFIGVLRCILT